MSTYHLDKLLRPRSVAIVGASPRPGSLGGAVFKNLRDRFQQPIMPVNPLHPDVDGIRAAPTLRDLPFAPDVVVVAVPPAIVPGVVEDAVAIGAPAAIIMTAGLGQGAGSHAERCAAVARKAGMRLLGPNCLGVIAPHTGFNASFAPQMPPAGDLALISQSGALVAAMVEWTARRQLGLSAMVSCGEQLDVDVADLLDYFAFDPQTRVILLYLEAIKDARKFMSAARAAARTKPVVVIKPGRHARAAQAAATHTGVLAGPDAVYGAAFQRAGLLRVLDLGELFDAAETLGRVKSIGGNRLAILTNGGGVGVLTLDRLLDLGGVPAEIPDRTRSVLDKVLPPTWSKSNPVDIVGDADATRYMAALEALLADPANDAVLVMNVPTALAPAGEIAERVAAALRATRAAEGSLKPVFAVWVGADPAIAETFSRARIPHYATETDAVRGFMHLVRHAEARKALMEVPPSLPQDFVPAPGAARDIVRRAVHEGRSRLDPVEAAAVFAAYAIEVAPTVFAATSDEAAQAAAPFLAQGSSVAVKIMSRDISHKSDVDGVRLGLTDAQAVRSAAGEIMARARAARPQARIDGVIVQPMIVRPKARELIAGLGDDPTFGPVILFGHGGTAVEVIDDTALALPPLDLKLAHDLINRTRAARLLQAYRNVPKADVEAVALTLVKLAQLAADVPEIREVDLNPLLADQTGVLAVDARITVAPSPAAAKGRGHPRFSVRPYPVEWERRLVVGQTWPVLVRPVRPQDEDLVRRFLERVSPEDLRLRFFAAVKHFSRAFIAQLTQLDYSRAMAFVAIDEASREMVGGVRLHADANHEVGEFAILLRSDVQGRGLGWKLMELIIEYARADGLRRIEGQVLQVNTVMIQMCREFGFDIKDDPVDRGISIASLRLNR